MPVLEEDGWPLPESAVIMEFLEERYPEPALLRPTRPTARSRGCGSSATTSFTEPYYALRRGADGPR